MHDELADLAFQIRHRVERAAADCLVGNQSKPALYLVQPGAIGRREVQMEPWPLGEPRTYLGVFVGAVIVADHVDIKIGRDISLDMSQETQL